MDEQAKLTESVQELKRAVRRSKWSEAGLEDKAEILKQEIIYLRNHVSSLSRLLEKIERHSHSPSGEILVPLKEDNMYCGESRLDPLQQ